MIFPPDNAPRGILFYVLATMLFCIADAIAKILSVSLPIIQINWMRYLIFALMAVALTLQNPGDAFRVRAPRMQIARGLCLVASSLLFVFGIRLMGMAEAATIRNPAPVAKAVPTYQPPVPIQAPSSEGGNIFNDQIRAGVGITIMVRTSKRKVSTLDYYAVPDHQTAAEIVHNRNVMLGCNRSE